jgi:hypothetical protein
MSSGSFADASLDSITVTELPDLAGEGFFGAALTAYRQEGYHAGYSRAIHDVIASVLTATAEFVHQQAPSDPATRQILLRFEQFLEHRLQTLAAPDFVEGGLGI